MNERSKSQAHIAERNVVDACSSQRPEFEMRAGARERSGRAHSSRSTLRPRPSSIWERRRLAGANLAGTAAVSVALLMATFVSKAAAEDAPPLIAHPQSGRAVAQAASGPAVAQTQSGPAVARATSGQAVAQAQSSPAVAHTTSDPAVG